ncbi:MAG: hypothetical protein O7D94_10905, partial [Planctomycetota bacterium]|nr:hypothetical protein [Planctomycetota bacterium]
MRIRYIACFVVLLLAGYSLTVSCARREPVSLRPDRAELRTRKAVGQDRIRSKHGSKDLADAAGASCNACHTVDSPTMHENATFTLSCIDCHGGVGQIEPADRADLEDARFKEYPHSEEYYQLMEKYHDVHPRFPEAWKDPRTGRISSANPVRSYTLLNYEDPDFIQFVNPGDLRIAHRTCGQCHMVEVEKVRKSMMTHGAQLWGAALYNNGSYPYKLPRFGESYSVAGEEHLRWTYPGDPDGYEGVAGIAQSLYTTPPPTEAERRRGVINHLDPLPRWEITQMGNILRAFERGGKVQRLEVEVGLPNVLEEGGKPDMKLSDRGLGTQLATDPVFLGIQKLRLLDPILSFLGTNEHPGDFRSSGCTACHVVYANDRSAVHSGPYAKYKNRGTSATSDKAISAKGEEPGHPIKHVMTSSIPSSQCIVCHVHPGTSYANTYMGFMWWDNETHGDLMYPAKQVRPTAEQFHQSLMRNPEAAAVRGLWSNLWPGEMSHHAYSHGGDSAGENFLENLTELNKQMDKTQFADFHGHGWVFKAVFKRDRDGNLLDRDGAVVAPTGADELPKLLSDAVAFQSKPKAGGGIEELSAEPARPPEGHPVHLKDIHLERGMHCVDCHFEQDVHGDGKLYGEVRNAIEIDCIDCHGTISKRASLVTSGPAAGKQGHDMRRFKTPFGARFEWRNDRLIQQSSVEKDLRWVVPQIKDSVDPRNKTADDPEKRKLYNEKAARAKLLMKGGQLQMGGLLSESLADPTCPENLAHGTDNMTCYACHTSWMTSCFGCHLPMRQNFRKPMLHNEGLLLRNYTTYNFQVLRDDVFMLGIDSTVKDHKIAPVRSSSAVIVGSANANREWVYSQQQTISSEGFSGQAFNPHYPHAVRKTETRACSDCHISEDNDNNAWMAQLLLQGTNFVNFLGRYVYVATGKGGFEAVVVTEREEPQAVFGSYLHELAYPAKFRRHVNRHHSELQEAHEHGLNDGPIHFFGSGGEILDLQMRGEYLYTARGKDGFYAYDIANIDNKGFSERIVTAPVSPLGQSFHVPTKYATAVASPTTLGVDPTRSRLSDDPDKDRVTLLGEPEPHHVNQEQAVHLLYAFLYVTDRYEGLVVIGGDESRNAGLGVSTLLDGDPMNNFLKRALTFNPGGVLDGAENLAIAGNYVYICCASGLVIVDISDPTEPRIAAKVESPKIVKPTSVAVQFRYAFVCDEDGLKVVDVTDPEQPRFIEGAVVRLDNANRVYVARTYAYIAAGEDGLV